MIRSLSFAALLTSPALALAGPPAGQIDPKFGEFDNGILGLQVEAFDIGGELSDRVYAMAEDMEGRLLLAGRVDTDNGPRLGLMRFNADGKLDTNSFGFNANQVAKGKIFHPELIPDHYLGIDLDILMMPDSSFFVAGATGLHPYICRFLADGRVSNSFGDGAGCVVLAEIDNSGTARAPQLLLAGESILVVTHHEPAEASIPALARISVENGEIEEIGQNAFAPLLVGKSEATLWDATLTADGGLIIVGSTTVDADDQDAFIARFDLHQYQPDLSFSGDGMVRFKFNKVFKGYDSFKAVELLPDGNILAAGDIEMHQRGGIAVAQVDASTGKMITGFNNGIPKTYDPCTALPDGCNRISVSGVARSPGHIVISGNAYGAVFASRLTAAGSVDKKFGSQGLARIELDGSQLGSAAPMLLQDERVVLATTANDGGDDNFALLRLSDGRLFKDEFEVAAP